MYIYIYINIYIYIYIYIYMYIYIYIYIYINIYIYKYIYISPLLIKLNFTVPYFLQLLCRTVGTQKLIFIGSVADNLISHH